MQGTLDRRAILVTGKGGVGKTTIAAALARQLAGRGRRVLCAEMAKDAAESSPLAAALGRESLEDEPSVVDANLEAVALSPFKGHQRFLRDALPWKILADAALRSSAIRRFLGAAPTFPEMGVLYHLLDLVRREDGARAPRYETIVVDLPATGHALALAQIPGSLLSVIPTGPVAESVREGLGLLSDPARTAAVVVTLPESLPVTESLELLRGIRSHGIATAGVIVNRVPFDPFSEDERSAVKRMLEGRPPTLGERMVERIDRARVALARLAHEGGVPVTTLHELFAEGPALSAELARALASGGS